MKKMIRKIGLLCGTTAFAFTSLMSGGMVCAAGVNMQGLAASVDSLVSAEAEYYTQVADECLSATDSWSYDQASSDIVDVTAIETLTYDQASSTTGDNQELVGDVDSVTEAFGDRFLVTGDYAPACDDVSKQILVESAYVDEVVADYKAGGKGDRLLKRWDVVSEVVDAYTGSLVITFEDEADSREALKEFRKRYGEDSCIMNQMISIQLADWDEPLLPNVVSWGSYRMGMDVLKVQPLPSGAKKDILVSVIDTGVDKSHKMFTGGRISSLSRNFCGTKSKYNDLVGHGTHVSGIIADATPPNVKILACKMMEDSGKVLISTVVDCLNYSINQNVTAINMSVSFSDFSDMNSVLLINKYITKAYVKGIPVCVAAGNEGRDALAYPASNAKTLAISSFNANEKLSVFSNHGNKITFAGPGENIWSAEAQGEYVSKNGTSMACPHITAACTYIKMLEPDLSVQGVINELKSRCVDLGPVGKDPYFGYGYPVLQDLFEAGIADPTDISRANVKTISNLSSGIKLTWNQVKKVGHYKLYKKTGNGKYKLLKTLSSSTTSYTDKKVSAGTKYTYRLLPELEGMTGDYGQAKKIARLTGVANVKLKALTPAKAVQPEGEKTPEVTNSGENTDGGMDDNKVGRGRMKLTWKKISKGSGIEIMYADNASFTDARSILVKKASTSRTIEGLKSGSWYVRVRVYMTDGSSKYYSAWSKAFKTKVQGA